MSEGTGDCYLAAGRYVLDHTTGDCLLVHAVGNPIIGPH